jgi:hypothetical protein
MPHTTRSGQSQLADRPAARALRLALDPCLSRPQGVAELALIVGERPRALTRAQRRLRCGDTEGRVRV